MINSYQQRKVDSKSSSQMERKTFLWCYMDHRHGLVQEILNYEASYWPKKKKRFFSNSLKSEESTPWKPICIGRWHPTCFVFNHFKPYPIFMCNLTEVQKYESLQIILNLDNFCYMRQQSIAQWRTKGVNMDNKYLLSTEKKFKRKESCPLAPLIKSATPYFWRL